MVEQGRAVVLPEVRLVQPGDVLRLCRCGRSAQRPDCPADCAQALQLTIRREQRLLLCRCGRSAQLPYCDGSHAPPASGWRAKWRRFWLGQ
ncbi:CDGSH iron-sulfur domain-containing protein [Pseudomonas sp. UL073]|uniref:CDGSH iron-sulfur domain-containing protein n=1 Tax=Zestomonas insulae TaxID=2809017 RepID=A0ABS2ICQ3_9GAMM|nr:CDGSH iron-sulfur domain-containing protein [Pseudomonas insulae]